MIILESKFNNKILGAHIFFLGKLCPILYTVLNYLVGSASAGALMRKNNFTKPITL